MDNTNPPIQARSTAEGNGPNTSLQYNLNGSVWLSVEQIRKRERMRRQRVLEAMSSGALPFEQRGRARYARLYDVIRWEETRLRMRDHAPVILRSDLSDFL